MGADADVVDHRQIGKQRDVLEGAADADLGDPVRRPLQDAHAFHQDVAGARLIEPGEAIEQRGLAGAVRPDQAEDLALMHVEGHAVQRDDAAEHDADVANRKQGDLPLRELCLRHVAPPMLMGRDRRSEASAGRDDEGYLIPSATRATFPPDLTFLISCFFDCRRRCAPEGCLDVPYHRHETRSNIVAQPIFREAECRRATVKRIRTGSVI